MRSLPTASATCSWVKPELVDQALVALSFLEGVQIGALKILDESERQHGPVVEVPDDSWNLCPTEPGHRPEPSLAGDELPFPVADISHDDGLQEPTCPDGGLELDKLGLGESATRLKTVRSDIRQANPLQICTFCARLGDRCRAGFALLPSGRDQRFEAASETSWSVRAHVLASDVETCVGVMSL